jgi:chromate transporter
MNLLTLFGIFFKYGLICFGGGYMLLPFMESDFLEGASPLISESDFKAVISVSQLTPGPIGINMATYFGFLQHGVIGGVVATLGMIAPALIITTIAIKLLKRYENSFPVRSLNAGMKSASAGFIAAAGSIFLGYSVFSAAIPYLDMRKLFDGTVSIDPGSLFIMVAVMAVLLKKKDISFVGIVVVSGILGAFICRT